MAAAGSSGKVARQFVGGSSRPPGVGGTAQASSNRAAQRRASGRRRLLFKDLLSLERRRSDQEFVPRLQGRARVKTGSGVVPRRFSRAAGRGGRRGENFRRARAGFPVEFRNRRAADRRGVAAAFGAAVGPGGGE